MTVTAEPEFVALGVLNYASEYDPAVVEQAGHIARLPFVWPHVALMPDAHVGKGSSVGTVIPTEKAVIPAAVGVDIGCGMIAAETTFTKADLGSRSLQMLRAMIEDAIPLSPGNYNSNLDRFPWTRERLRDLEYLANKDENGTDLIRPVDLSHSPKWKEQLGSLGGGNHFIELCLDERDVVWMTLHSGSRGVGNKIAQRHIKVAQQLMKQWFIKLPDPDLSYLVQGTPEFTNYLKELNWAQQFALLNREEMMARFGWCLHRWMGAPADDFNGIKRHVAQVINCHHNYTKVENHFGRNVWVTRKGAIDAHEGVKAMIPGSMGTRSYIVTGKGNVPSLCSAPHGAGRRFSRNEAKKRFTEADLAKAMEGIEYRHGAEWVDEIPAAYKDIDQVMADAGHLVSVDHTLRQILNVKGV